jgi:hypothetical protein
MNPANDYYSGRTVPEQFADVFYAGPPAQELQPRALSHREGARRQRREACRAVNGLMHPGHELGSAEFLPRMVCATRSGRIVVH